MDTTVFQQESECKWVMPPSGRMRVPGIIYASEDLVTHIDSKVLEQLAHVASLPGIVIAAYAMPDAHRGYGFPIGGVAGFDPDEGIVSAGGVGFDISCGVRTMLTGIAVDELEPVREKLADALFHAIPAGIGSTGKLRLNQKQMDSMLSHGARWAIANGYGVSSDAERIENHGEIAGALLDQVSERARKRQQDQMGTLGSGNHYLEVQQIAEIYDISSAQALGLREGEIVISIHCGSRGLGHQVATEFSSTMVTAAGSHGIYLPDRELACAPARSPEGEAYLGAMRGAMNCALANRQILTHLVRETVRGLFRDADCPLLYDVSHNTCNLEEHVVGGKSKQLLVHRKGATRAFGPNHPDLPADLKAVGQPVLIGGTMGTASYVLVGRAESESLSFSSACHGAGRSLSRTQASRQWHGGDIIRDLARKNILIRTRSNRGIAEEAPGAYKDVSSVVEATEKARFARKVARLTPLICIKG